MRPKKAWTYKEDVEELILSFVHVPRTVTEIHKFLSKKFKVINRLTVNRLVKTLKGKGLVNVYRVGMCYQIIKKEVDKV